MLIQKERSDEGLCQKNENGPVWSKEISTWFRIDVATMYMNLAIISPHIKLWWGKPGMVIILLIIHLYWTLVMWFDNQRIHLCQYNTCWFHCLLCAQQCQINEYSIYSESDKSSSFINLISGSISASFNFLFLSYFFQIILASWLVVYMW